MFTSHAFVINTVWRRKGSDTIMAWFDLFHTSDPKPITPEFMRKQFGSRAPVRNDMVLVDDIVLDDTISFELATTLDLDLYGGLPRVYDKENLQGLHNLEKKASAAFRNRHDFLKESVLKKCKKTAWQDWMDKMLEEVQECDSRYTFYKRLLEMILKVKANQSFSLVYMPD